MKDMQNMKETKEICHFQSAPQWRAAGRGDICLPAVS